MDINSWLLFCVNPLSAHFAEILYGESARVISLSVFSFVREQLTLLKWPTRLTVTFLWTLAKWHFTECKMYQTCKSHFNRILISWPERLDIWSWTTSGLDKALFLCRCILFIKDYFVLWSLHVSPLCAENTNTHTLLCTGSPWHYFVDFIFSNHISQRLNIFHQYFATVESKLWSVLDSF